MIGGLYVLLCFLVGRAMVERFLPELRSPDMNVHRILQTDRFLGRPRSLREAVVRPWMLIGTASYLTGTLTVTWTVYLLAYLLRDTAHPLLWGNIAGCGICGIGSLFLTGSDRLFRSLLPRVDDMDRLRGRIRDNRTELLLLATCTLLSLALCSLTLFRRGDDLCMGLSVFSDFTTHISQARSFSLGHNFPTEYVFFADGTIRYHFLFQFLAGNLEYLGLPLSWAYNLESVLAFTAMFSLLFELTVALTGSRSAGLLACLLAFCRSSFAFFTFLRDLPPGTSAVRAILQLNRFIGGTPHEDWGLWNQNVFVNQRHLPFAVGVFLLALLVLLPLFAAQVDRLHRKDPPDGAGPLGAALRLRPAWLPESRRRPLFLGTLLGASCFWNGAVYLGALMVLFALAWVSDHRLEHLILAVVALTLGILQKAFFFGAGAPGIRPVMHLGFLTPDPTWIGTIGYYTELLGILPAMGLAAALYLPLRGRFRLALAMAMPFLMANLVSLTVDISTNHKYIQLSLWLGSVLVAALLAEMMRYRKALPFALGLTALLTVTGFIDLISLGNINAPSRAVVIQEKAPLRLWIQEHLDPDGIILSKNYYMHPALAAGRKLFNGWQYYTWSAGYDSAGRDRVVRTVLEGADPGRLADLLRKNRIRYLLIDDETRREFRVREDLFEREASVPEGCLRKLYAEGGTVIYQVKPEGRSPEP
jgi:hypothetical protein